MMTLPPCRVRVRPSMMALALLSIVFLPGCTGPWAQDVPKKHFAITDFGAVADGKTLNTVAIQQAIDTAAVTAGGGVVDIPKGVFYSGSIFLKNGVELNLDE